MKNSNVIGIDLAKNVLQVCKVSKHGELTVNKAISLTCPLKTVPVIKLVFNLNWTQKEVSHAKKTLPT